MTAWRYIRDESLAVPLFALTVLITLLVSPTGDFPLNDDWVYAGAVQDILETGQFAGHSYSDALFVLQAYWGALWCSVFGFSFTVLRCSSLLTLYVAAWAASKCATEMGVSRSVALLVGVVFLANPIVLNLSYTFMTDIPFLALAHLSLFGFLRASRTGNLVSLLLASVAAACAYLVRQFGLLIPMAFVATEVYMGLRTRSWRWGWKHIAVAISPWMVSLLWVSLLPESAKGLGTEIDWNTIGYSIFNRIGNGFRHFVIASLYLVLFLSPLLIARVMSHGRPRFSEARVAWICGFVLFLLAAKSIGDHFVSRMPITGNILYDFGVGPILLRGIVVRGVLQAPVQIGELWSIVTWLCLAGTAYLLVHLGRIALGFIRLSNNKAEERDLRPLFLLVLGFAFILALFVPGLPMLYERYYLMALLPVALLLLHSCDWVQKRLAVSVCWGLTASMFCFSIVALQDYMAWNIARWNAATVLQSEYQATPEQIDGGYEYNGWLTSGIFLEGKSSSDRRDYGPKGLWVVDDQYAISMLERENFELLDEVAYYSWLGFEERSILILRRVDSEESTR